MVVLTDSVKHLLNKNQFIPIIDNSLGFVADKTGFLPNFLQLRVLLPGKIVFQKVIHFLSRFKGSFVCHLFQQQGSGGKVTDGKVFGFSAEAFLIALAVFANRHTNKRLPVPRCIIGLWFFSGSFASAAAKKRFVGAFHSKC